MRHDEVREGHAMGRRGLLVTGAASALTLGAVSFAGAAPHTDGEIRVVRGVLPPDAPDYVYLPVEVGRGVRELAVSYGYERPAVPAGTPGNALDIGIFDERGVALGGEGFRGWSGGARTSFFIRADDATPGYVAGPVRAGVWHIVLGPYTVAPRGLPYEVTITLRYGEPGRTPERIYPPERAGGRGRAWYRGDCHLHSWHSDGRRTPGEIAALARAAGLDFIHTSEHNTHAGQPFWAEHAGDDLLILTGEEITTRTGHVLALGTDPGTFVDWRYRARENRFGRFAREIRRAGGLVVPAHPHASCVGCGWKFGLGEADAVEVWNGSYTADDEVSLQAWDAALARGRWIPAMGNSDAHRDPDPVGGPQTVVLAEELTRAAVLEGLRRGRSYVVESSAVSLALSAGDGRGRRAGIGERLRAAADAPVTVRFAVAGAPDGGSVRLVTEQGVLLTRAAADLEPGSGTGADRAAGAGARARAGAGAGSDAGAGAGGWRGGEWRTGAGRAGYARLEVRHPSGRLAGFTNPVFLGG
ncbi:CehA/McbA family metallohydrolase [Streptomyces sp. NPDC014894]|uniref:CehA/McbA family metallohydrolase n=1 Tax=Streptomyces sp. NPDC014894 TaxID=3364931 RepID=UPI0037018D3F